jgi:hypothetical protein
MLNNPNDPKKGDRTTLRLPLPAKKGASYRLSLEVENRYENKKLTGRIEWTLYVDERLVHQEDIALSRQAKKFELEIEKAGPVVTLKIVLKALKNCEPWTWGGASKLFIGNVRLVPTD